VHDKEDLKQRLPLPYVASALGILPGPERALCPFHEDREHPNLDVTLRDPDGSWWFYCRNCGAFGDVFTLLQRVEGLAFPAAMRRASEMLDTMPTRWDALNDRGPSQRQEVTEETQSYVRSCLARAEEHADVGLLSYTYGFVDEETDVATRRVWDQHLLSWGWGLDELGNVVIPHFDTGGKLEAVKVRYRNGRWTCGGQLRSLYGAWRYRRADPLHWGALLCEGESDAVWADLEAQSAGTALDAYALPSGAGSMRDEWVDRLSSYGVVFLGLDADAAGARATEKWADALGGRGPEVVELPIKGGEDLRSDGRALSEIFLSAGRVVSGGT
jgi:hypothetical protein